MLTVYRRHSSDCEQRSRRYSKACSCPLWIEGTVEGEYIRRSLKARSWTRAQQLARELEEGGRRITVKDAIKSFTADAKARNLKAESIVKYTRLLARLQTFADENNKSILSDFDVDLMRRFRESWKVQNYTALKELERLRTFFRFAVSSDWIAKNPVQTIKSPRVQDPPTMPFTRDEFKRVIDACADYPNSRNAVRLKALTMLLRYSGLRITDAVCLERRRIKNGVLSLTTAKTGTHVRIPLPPACIAALEAIDSGNEYFFWSGFGTRKAAVGDYQRAFKKLYELAKIENGHAHRWRDTFAVELLLAGTPIERVSAFLGHQSIKVTERHYSPWNKARQDQAEQDARRAWSGDEMAG